MERKQLLKDAKRRKKCFLKEMPDDQRRLLKMYQRTKHNAKALLYAVPVVVLILLLLYLASGFYFRYENRWLINGIILIVVSLILIVILLLERHASKNKIRALSAPIKDFIDEYEKINDQIKELRKDN